MARTTTCLVAAVVALAAPAEAEVGAHEIEAGRLFEQGERAYGEGRFGEAAELMRRAYALHAEPILLYNLGRALEGDEDPQGAIDAYTRYLEAAPSASNRGLVERRLDALTRQLQEESARGQALRDAEARPRGAEGDTEQGSAAPSGPERRSISPLPWVVAGIGLATVATGGVLGTLALDRQATARDDPVQLSAHEALEEGRQLAMAANITLIAGGVVAAAGLVWGVVDVLVLSLAESDAVDSSGLPEPRTLGAVPRRLLQVMLAAVETVAMGLIMSRGRIAPEGGMS